MQKFLILLLKIYQMGISPYLGRNCRFHPTCSSYARQAIARYGSLRGSWLTVKRISRCHPWHEGGVDPVPPSP